MSFWSNNPVLEREIRGRLRLRRKGGLGANVWIARAIGLVILYYYSRGLLALWRGTSQDARDLWPLLIYSALALIVLLAPVLTATAITQEREQQTWEILATTRLSGADILLGKWLGRQMIPWLLLAILLPYMAICAARASFSWLMLPAMLIFLLITSACYSAFGLLCSFQAKRTMTATASALTITALLCIGTIAVNQVFGLLLSPTASNYEWPVLWTNPFYVLTHLINAFAPDTFGGINQNADPADAIAFYCLGTLALTAAMLGFMVSRYRQAVRERS